MLASVAVRGTKGFASSGCPWLDTPAAWGHMQSSPNIIFHHVAEGVGMVTAVPSCGKPPLCRCFVSASWRGDLRGRCSPAEKLVPQTLISQVKLCCCVPPFPAWRKTAVLAWSNKDEKANVAQSLPLQSGDRRLSDSGVISFPLLHRQLNWEWRLPITRISSLIW